MFEQRCKWDPLVQTKRKIEQPTRWRWTAPAYPYRAPEYGDTPSGGTCAAYFPAYGSWFRVAYVAYVSPINGSVGWYELELECTPALLNGDPDTEAWGPVEEHGFECMGLPEDHTHDPEAVQWMDSINGALAATIPLAIYPCTEYRNPVLGIPFSLEDYE
jgi:hypothetical protein